MSIKERTLRDQLIRAGTGSAGIQAGNRVLSLVLGILLARNLGAEGYGVYAYAFAVMALLMVPAEAGVPTLIMREIAANHARGHWPLLRGALIRAFQFVGVTSSAIALIGLIVLWLIGPRLSEAQYLTMVFMLLVLPFAVLIKTTSAALRGLLHVLTGQALRMLLQPLTVILLLGTLFYSLPEYRQPQLAMAGQIAGGLFVLSVALWMLWRRMPEPARVASPEYQDAQWRRSILPLTLFGAAGIVQQSADIIMLGWFRSSAEVGFYRVGTQGAAVATLGLHAINAVVGPHFSRLYTAGDMARLQKLVTRSAQAAIVAASPVALLFVVGGGQIASWVFGPEFAASHGALAILAVGQVVNAIFGSVGLLLNMTGHEARCAQVFWQAAGLNVLLNLMFIPAFGLEGAAVASVASVAYWNLRLFIFTRHHLSIHSAAFGHAVR